MPAVLDQRTIQHQLLESPGDPALWQALSRAATSPKPETPEQPPSQAAPPAPKPAQRAPKPKPSRSATPTSTIRPGTPRPIQRRFHPEGSPEVEAVRRAQLAELQALAEANQHDAALERLGRDLVEPLAAQLPPAAAYGLGHWAYEQERFEVAAPLLASVLAAGEAAGDLLPWAELFLGLSCRGLGEIGRTREQLTALMTQHPSHDAAFHAQLALAWLDLNAGLAPDAAKALDQLRQHPQASSNLTELDLLGRVLSTLEWLGGNPRDQISHAMDRASTDGVVAAIDAIRLSRCGRVLQLQGWLVDPGQQLRELCLVRGERVWRLNLGQARYVARPDLAEVVARCGGDTQLHPGLTLTQIALAEEAVPLQAGEAAELFAVLANGTQFCLRRTLQGTELSSEQVKEALDAAIQETVERYRNTYCTLVGPHVAQQGAHPAADERGAAAQIRKQITADTISNGSTLDRLEKAKESCLSQNTDRHPHCSTQNFTCNLSINTLRQIPEIKICPSTDYPIDARDSPHPKGRLTGFAYA